MMRLLLPIIFVVLFWIIFALAKYNPTCVGYIKTAEIVIGVLLFITLVKKIARYYLNHIN